MQTSELYLKQTDTEGRLTITEHTVWDSARFLQARHKDSMTANNDVLKKNPDYIPLAKVEVITRDEYRAYKWPKKH